MSPRPKFAVVREDPELECTLVTAAARMHGRPARAVVVASGGCTALTLASRFPEGELAAFDFSRLQLAHGRAKMEAILGGDRVALDALLQCGWFEGLFRTLRTFLEEFVAPPAELRRFFSDLREDAPARAAMVDRWRADPYFDAAFELAFHERFLHAMFGPDATRHAAPGSYGPYFRRAFLRALRAESAAKNPYLQHVLLGRYVEQDAPGYLHATRFGPIAWIEGTLLDVPALGRYDVFSLSNVFDWSDDALVMRWAGALSAEAREGAVVLLRFLNNDRDVLPFFAPHFRRDEELSRQLFGADRSFFYERIEVLVRS